MTEVDPADAENQKMLANVMRHLFATPQVIRVYDVNWFSDTDATKKLKELAKELHGR